MPSSYSLCIYQGTHVVLLADDISHEVFGYPLDLVSNIFDSIQKCSKVLPKSTPLHHSIPNASVLARDFHDISDQESRYNHQIFEQVNRSSALVQCAKYGSPDSLHFVHVSSGKTDYNSCTSSTWVSTNENNEFGSFQVIHHDLDGIETCLSITGAKGGYFVTDFASFHGHGGYEQILFLPELDPRKEIQEDGLISKEKEDPMKLLQSYLEYCVLTDGTHLLYSGSHVNIEQRKEGVHVQLKTVPRNFTTTIGNHLIRKRKRNLQKEQISDESFGQVCIAIAHQEKSSTTTSKDSKKLWQKKLRQGIERQMQRECQNQQKKRNIHILEEKMIQLSQRTLARLSLTKNPSIRKEYELLPPMLEVVRLRYILEPSHQKVQNENIHAIQIHLEVDLRYNFSKGFPDGKGLGHLRDVQLFAMTHHDEIDTSKQMKIHTSSCVVPSFHQGDCFRLSALVHLSGIQIDPTLSDVLIYLNAFFRYFDCTEMTGSVLGSLTLPMKEVLRFRNEGIFKEISVSSSGSSYHSIHPSAIFEYRIPKILVINSSDSSSNSLKTVLQDLCDSINDIYAPRQRVDLLNDESHQKAHLSLFSPTPEEGSMLLALVYDQLPEDLHIVDETNITMTKEYVQSCFFEAAKVELKLMYNYASRTKESSSFTLDVAKLSAARNTTNEVFAKLRRG